MKPFRLLAFILFCCACSRAPHQGIELGNPSTSKPSLPPRLVASQVTVDPAGDGDFFQIQFRSDSDIRILQVRGLAPSQEIIDQKITDQFTVQDGNVTVTTMIGSPAVEVSFTLVHVTSNGIDSIVLVVNQTITPNTFQEEPLSSLAEAPSVTGIPPAVETPPVVEAPPVVSTPVRPMPIFTPATTDPTTMVRIVDRVSSVASGDVDGDGNEDLVLFGVTSLGAQVPAEFAVLFGNGNGGLSAPLFFHDENYSGIAIRGQVLSIDGDSIDDIVLFQQRPSEASSIVIRYGDSERLFARRTRTEYSPIPSPSQNLLWGMSDLYGDAGQELFLADTTPNESCVPSPIMGCSSYMLQTVLPTLDMRAIIGYFGVASPKFLDKQSTLFDDVDVDGHKELFLMVYNEDASRMGVFSFSFSTSADNGEVRTFWLPSSVFPVEGTVAVSDVNDDHVKDILLVQSNYQDGLSRVLMMPAQEAHVFDENNVQNVGLVGAFSGGIMMTSSDLNRDGRSDLILVDTVGNLQVLLHSPAN